MTTRSERRTTVARVALSAFLVALGAGCATADAVPVAAPVNPALAIDADPLALFPPGAVALADLDTHTFYTSGSLGGQVAAIAEGILPLGQEMGFSASRDVDRIFVAGYAGASIDAVAVLSGRFDVARMQAAVAAHATSRSGLPWSSAPYAGRTLYSTANVAFAPLTEHTLAAGNESAVRRVLDRLAQPAAAKPGGPRDVPDWMLKTVESPGAAFALAADVGAIPPAALQGLPLPGAMAGLSRLAVIGDFHPPGVNVAGTLSYADPTRAAAGASSLQQLAAIVAVAGQLGAAPKLQNLTIQPDGPSVSCKFVLDEEALKRSLASVMKLFASASARPARMTHLVVHGPAGGLRGSVRVPSDKSIGHRALLLSAVATGSSRILGFSRGEDNLSTLTALRALGVRVDEIEKDELTVHGVSLRGLRAPEGPLDCGNSGTTMRLMAGLLAAQPFMSTLVGDASLSSRPMKRVVIPLRARGARIDGVPHPLRPTDVTAPLTIGPLAPGARLGPLEYESPISSAQVKSLVLLSGLDASGPTHFREPILSRDHTERMLRTMGAPLATMASQVSLDPTGWDGRLAPIDLTIPGDLSAASFLLVAAQITPGSNVTVRDVGLNPTRTGILEIARDMGAGLAIEPGEERGGEPVGTVHGFHAPLLATRAGGERVARAIDEIPIVCALAARAEGSTRIEGAGELRAKESDRIAMMCKTLRAFGVGCEELGDGLVIEGSQERLRAARVDSGGDHRVAMTAAVLALIADGASRIDDVACIGTSFPKFVATLRALGARIDVVDA